MFELKIEKNKITGFIGDVPKILTIPEGVKAIGTGLFKEQEIEELYLPQSLESLGRYAFGGCKKLLSVSIPNDSKLKEISLRAFEACTELNEIIIPSGIEKLSSCCFAGCKNLTNVVLPDRLIEIDSGAFFHCYSLRSIEFPPLLTSISYESFKGCHGLFHLIFHNISLNIDMEAFEGCTSLQSLELPQNTTICSSCFSNCSSLTKLYICGEKINLMPFAFSGCSSLKDVYTSKMEKSWLYTVFSGCPLEKIHIISNLGFETIIHPLELKKDFESDLIRASMFYHMMGMNYTKIRGNGIDNQSFKTIDKDWNYQLEDFYDKAQSNDLLMSENWNGATGLGLVLGFNGYHAIDVDHVSFQHSDVDAHGSKHDIITLMIKECLELLGLNKNYPWVVVSGSGTGFHIIFQNTETQEKFSSKAYTSNHENNINHFHSGQLFGCMELRWRDHLILPPSIHRCGGQYEFLNGQYPSIPPTNIKIGKVDELICHFCGCVSINSYNYGEKKLELSEMNKYYATYHSCSRTIERKEETLDWLLHCDTPNTNNTIGIKYVLGRDVQCNKDKAYEYLKKSGNDLALFNLASLTACGYFNGTQQDVKFYLNGIEDKSIFVQERDKDDYGDYHESKNHFKLIKSNSSACCSSEKLILFFDTETTGIPKDYNAPSTETNIWPRLVQLGWMITDNSGKLYKKTKTKIIYPDGFSIPNESIKVHGITQEKAETEGSVLSDVLDEFYNDFKVCELVVGHNISFDIHVIASELIRLGRNQERDELESCPTVCTMKGTTDFCEIPGFYGYKYPKLQQLFNKVFGINFNDAHDAGADVEATCKCYHELKKRGIL